MNLGEFIDNFKDAIARRVVESYPPLYRPSEDGHMLPRLLRTPLGAQADAIRGAALSLKAHRGTTVVGEMGTGKTFIGAAAAHMAGFQRILVICPPHLVPKWKREIEQTVPGVRAAIVESITDLERLRLSIGSGPLFAVISRERAKLSYRWMPAVIERWATSRGRLLRDEETGEPFRVPCCPDCTAQIVDKDGVPLTHEDLNRRKHVCSGCRAPLWQADRSGPARYPLADYVKHHMRGFFDLLIGDEVHEFKGRGSAQGIAAGVLADVCGKSLSLTGTLLGGYSSTIFHLLYRFSPEIRTEFGRSDEHRWIQRYGFEEVTVGKPDDDAVEDGRNSRRRKYRKVTRERPGLVPIGPVPHHRQHRLPAPLGRCLRPAGLRGEDTRVLDGLGGGRHRLLPAQRLQHRVRGAEEGAGGRAQGWLEAAAGDLPANPPRLPRRLHQGGDGLRPQDGRRHRPGPAPVRGEALPEGEGRWSTSWPPSGWRAAGCWSTRPTRGPGTSPGGWTTSSPGTGSGWR